MNGDGAAGVLDEEDLVADPFVYRDEDGLEEDHHEVLRTAEFAQHHAEGDENGGGGEVRTDDPIDIQMTNLITQKDDQKNSSFQNYKLDFGQQTLQRQQRGKFKSKNESKILKTKNWRTQRYNIPRRRANNTQMPYKCLSVNITHRISEISAHQKQWFFKGGSTQNPWLLMGDFSKGGVHKTDGVKKNCFSASKN